MKIDIGSGGKVLTGGNMTGSVMGISNDKPELIAYYMRDRIYNDKILAVVREYIQNALDEHYKYNIVDPVAVNLVVNSDGDCFFKVRDFAKGLSDEGVRSIFGQLFASTKSENNGNMGGFGVGSKAGHAYRDSFMVISYHSGSKTTYSCVLEPHPETKIPQGKIYDMSTEETTESGIEIIVPVLPSDISKFQNTLDKFYSTVRDTAPLEIKVFGDVLEPSLENNINFKLGDENYSISIFKDRRKTGGYFVKNKVFLRMGDMSYPMPEWAGFKDPSKFNIYSDVIITVPVGTLTVSLNREGIEDTPKNTNIVEKLADKIKELSKEARSKYVLTWDEIKSGKNRYEDGIFEWNLEEWGMPRLIPTVGEDNSKNKKTWVVSIPKNRATSVWKSKVDRWSTELPENEFVYYYVAKGSGGEPVDIKEKLKDLASHVEVVSVAKFRRILVKREIITTESGGEASYKVYKGYYSANTYTPQEYVDDLGDIPDLNKIKTLQELRKFSFYKSPSNTMGTDIPRVTSKRMESALVKLGVYNWQDVEVVARRKKLEAKSLEESENSRVYYSYVTRGFFYKPTTVVLDRLQKAKQNNSPRMKKHYTRIKKMEKVIKNAQIENSFRGEIMKSCGYSTELSRKTFRKLWKSVD